MEKMKLIKEIKFPGKPIPIGNEEFIQNEIIITHIYQHNNNDTQTMLRGVLRSEDSDEIPYIQPYKLDKDKTNV